MTERTYLIFHPTRLAYLRWYLIAILIFVVGMSIFFDFLPITKAVSDYKIYILAFFIVSTIIFVLFAEVLRKNDKYAVTNHRVIEKAGIINIKEDSIYWEKVSNYSLKQNIFERLFKIGTIFLWSTGGEEKPEVVIKSAPNVKRIRYVLDKLIEKK